MAGVAQRTHKPLRRRAAGAAEPYLTTHTPRHRVPAVAAAEETDMKNALIDVLKSRLIGYAVFACLLFCLGIHFYTQWDLARFEAQRNDGPPARATQTHLPETQAGHFHADGTFHAEPPSKSTLTDPSSGSAAVATGGYWENGKWHPPSGYVPAHPRGQTSSNPFFAAGVPEHLKCPQEYIGVYLWATGEYQTVVEKIKPIGIEVMEQYNPNRPIHEVWPRFIDDEKFYQANADIPPLDPERYPPGSFAEWAAAPERMEAVDRIDWLVQHALDYPEILALMYNDSTMYTNAWRAELGFDPPDWNLVTLPDGRQFREKSGYRYEFTYTEGHQTHTYKGGHSGGKDAPLVKVNLNETSDEELRAFEGWDFSKSPYRQEGHRK